MSPKMARVFRPPYRLCFIHTALILFFMFALWMRWFLAHAPHDCFYVPFCIASGPVVYGVAHMAQHLAEEFFSPEQVMISWNLVPGLICLVFGGVQRVVIEWLWLMLMKRRTGSLGRTYYMVDV